MEMTDWRPHRTTRWRGVIGASLVALTVGLALDRPEAVLLAVIGVVYAVYPQLTRTPAPSVRIERRLSERTPQHGDTVRVSVVVHNDSERPLFDVRVVDGVPSALTVSGGSPRHATVLLPGQSTTFSYTVTAVRGKHRFEPATVVVRDLSGEHEVTASISTESEIDCAETSTSVPLRRQTLAFVGQVLAEQGGSGVQFHRTREYRRGDPMSWIDWKRYARTGDLTTIEFHQEQTAAVILLVDARDSAYRARSTNPHAVTHSVAAARQLSDALFNTRNHVGIAGIGRSFVWIPPSAGRHHIDTIDDTLTTHETFSSVPPGDQTTTPSDMLQQLPNHLPDSAQVLVFSPLTDDEAVRAARTVHVNGNPVGVISPDVTEQTTPERHLAGIERNHRIGDLRNADIPVVDWDPDRPLAAAIATSVKRWSG